MYDDLSLTYFKPRSINTTLQSQLFKDLPSSVKDIGRSLLDKEWRFYITDQKRGWCNTVHRVITLPSWVITHPHHNISAQHIPVTPESILGYKCWYICHEMSHALVGAKHNHDAVFMAKLIEICPEEWTIFELSYKPRNAAKAGIGQYDLATQLGFT